jgi:hypothetical protein
MDSVIKFAPALPCCTLNGDRPCGNPATVGLVWYNGNWWSLQPICRSCTEATAKVYRVISLDDELKPGREQPQDEPQAAATTEND